MEQYMCMYYGEGNSNAYFRCYSEGNDTGKGTSHIKDSFFFKEHCRRAGADGCAKQCPYFVMPRGQENQSRTTNPQTGIAATGMRPQASAGTSRQDRMYVSDRYTFVPEKGMCKYYRRSENDRKKYQCLSPGNGQGADFLFETLGGSVGAEHFRRQCRRCNEAGEPPKCDFYPGAVPEVNGQGTGDIIGEGVKNIVHAAMNPAGSIAETVVGSVAEQAVKKLFE